jgi:hypothetical protein
MHEQFPVPLPGDGSLRFHPFQDRCDRIGIQDQSVRDFAHSYAVRFLQDHEHQVLRVSDT